MKQIVHCRNVLLTIFSILASPVVESKGTNYTFHHKHWNAQLEGELKWNTIDGGPPLLIAHRGDVILSPEQTIPSFELACHLGADFLEIDLMLTKDRHLVTYHDSKLREGTDVESHPEFAYLAKKQLDGSYDWYLRDFTLMDLKRLHVQQHPIGVRVMSMPCLDIPTLDDLLNTVGRLSVELNRTFGLILELKHPEHHNELEGPGLMEKQLIRSLKQHGYPIKHGDPENCTGTVNGIAHPIPCPPIIIQMNETEFLRNISRMTDLDLMLLVKDPEHLTPRGMEEMVEIGVDYFGTWKEIALYGPERYFRYMNESWDPEVIQSYGGFVKGEEIPAMVRKLGMKYLVETIYDSREYATRTCLEECGLYMDKAKETAYYLELGADGLLMDNIAESRDFILRFARRKLMQELKEGEYQNQHFKSTGPLLGYTRIGPESPGWCQEVGYCEAYRNSM